jgi:hypothetical protein
MVGWELKFDGADGGRFGPGGQLQDEPVHADPERGAGDDFLRTQPARVAKAHALERTRGAEVARVGEVRPRHVRAAERPIIRHGLQGRFPIRVEDFEADEREKRHGL